jgi:hypothetical protein
VRYEIPDHATVLTHAAAWVDVDNIKDKSAESHIVAGQVVATGSVRGRDKEFFNCPGGGHATLELTTIERVSESRVESPPIEIGSSEVRGSLVSFNAPDDTNLRTRAYRIDLRPMSSSEKFAGIELLGCADESRDTYRTVFGQNFHVKCIGQAIFVDPVDHE